MKKNWNKYPIIDISTFLEKQWLQFPYQMCGTSVASLHQTYSLSTFMTDQIILSGFLTEILVVIDTEGGRVYKTDATHWP